MILSWPLQAWTCGSPHWSFPFSPFMKFSQNTRPFMAGMNAKRSYRGCNPHRSFLRCPALKAGHLNFSNAKSSTCPKWIFQGPGFSLTSDFLTAQCQFDTRFFYVTGRLEMESEGIRNAIRLLLSIENRLSFRRVR